MRNVSAIFVSSDGSGLITQGHRVICSECGNEAFQVNVLYLTNGSHTHIVCTRCETSFCDNECAKGKPVINREQIEEN